MLCTRRQFSAVRQRYAKSCVAYAGQLSCFGTDSLQQHERDDANARYTRRDNQHTRPFRPRLKGKIRRYVPESQRKSLDFALCGFSEFSSVKEVRNVLVSKRFNYRSISPIFERGMVPSGDWYFQTHQAMRSEDLTEHVALKFPHLTVKHVSKPPSARDLGISNRTVLMQNVPAGIGRDEIMYFFKDFRIHFDEIRHVKKWDGTQSDHVLVQFGSAVEASAAVRQNLYRLIEGHEINLYWYDI